MSSAPDMNAQMDSKLVDSLLTVNQLSYRMPPAINIANKVTHTIQYSQQASYDGGSTMIWDLQTGNSFIDANCSYLRFVVTPSDGTHCFGSGSAASLFERVIIRSRTGKELSRVENSNLLSKFMDRYQKSEEWLRTVGKAQGYSVRNQATAAAVYADAVPATGKLFVIPLCAIFPCFNLIGSKLIPPQVASGLRVEIRLASPNDAFCSVDQSTKLTLASYIVSKPEMHVKEYTLNDNFQRAISEMANQGLNLLYKEHYNTIVSQTTNQINYDIKKAVSKALKLSVITRKNADLSTAGADRFASLPYNFEKIQSNCGSDYVPNQPLSIDGAVTADNVNEAYYYCLEEADKLEYWNTTSVNPAQFLGRENDGTVADVFSNGMVCFSYNRSNTSQLAGYTISNSRALLVNLTQQGAAVSVRLDTFLTYLRLAKCMNTNTLVLD